MSSLTIDTIDKMKRIIKNNKETITTIIFVLVLMIDITLNVFSHYFNVPFLLTKLIIIFLLLTILIIVNRKLIINRSFIYIITFLILFSFVNIISVNYTGDVINEVLKLFILGVSVLFIALQPKNYGIIVKALFILSIVYIAMVLLIIPDVSNNSFNYMHYGFIINIAFLGIALKYLERKNLLLHLLFILLLILGGLFGHRGATLVNLGLYSYMLIFSTKYKKTFFAIILGLPMILFIYYKMFTESVLNILINIQVFFEDYRLYSLSKVISSIRSGGIDSSGRNELYTHAIEMIKDKYYIFPNGLGSFSQSTEFDFPHTLILDMYVIFGGFTIIIIGYLLYKLFIFYRSYLNQTLDINFHIFNLFFIYSFLRLLTGGTFINEPFFWAVLGLLLLKTDKNIEWNRKGLL